MKSGTRTLTALDVARIYGPCVLGIFADKLPSMHIEAFRDTIRRHRDCRLIACMVDENGEKWWDVTEEGRQAFAEKEAKEAKAKRIMVNSG